MISQAQTQTQTQADGKPKPTDPISLSAYLLSRSTSNNPTTHWINGETYPFGRCFRGHIWWRVKLCPVLDLPTPLPALLSTSLRVISFVFIIFLMLFKRQRPIHGYAGQGGATCKAESIEASHMMQEMVSVCLPMSCFARFTRKGNCMVWVTSFSQFPLSI